MFGGWGLYLDDRFFAVIAFDRLYLKTSEVTVAPFVAAGMEPFMEEGKVILPRYYEVPLEVLENHLELGRWSQIAAALSEPKVAKKPSPKRPGQSGTAKKGRAGGAGGKVDAEAKRRAGKARDRPSPDAGGQGRAGARRNRAASPGQKATTRARTTRRADGGGAKDR
jgi:DNA transformation protein